MTALREIEEWTGHKHPRGGMPWLRILIALFVGLVIATAKIGATGAALGASGITYLLTP